MILILILIIIIIIILDPSGPSSNQPWVAASSHHRAVPDAAATPSRRLQARTGKLVLVSTNVPGT